jgi:hypothetical protein
MTPLKLFRRVNFPAENLHDLFLNFGGVNDPAEIVPAGQ